MRLCFAGSSSTRWLWFRRCGRVAASAQKVVRVDLRAPGGASVPATLRQPLYLPRGSIARAPGQVMSVGVRVCLYPFLHDVVFFLRFLFLSS